MKQKSIEYRVTFVVGYFGVPIIYLLTSSGMSIEEIVRVLEIQTSLWVFSSKMILMEQRSDIARTWGVVQNMGAGQGSDLSPSKSVGYVSNVNLGNAKKTIIRLKTA